MTMTEKEICRDFNEAKNKGTQVGILADLNVCEKEDILRILILNGQDVTAAGPRKLGGEKDKVLNLMYTLLDEMEEQIKATERRYLNIVESMKQYGKERKK